MRIKVLKYWANPEFVARPGQWVDVPVEVARHLVDTKQAENVDPFPPDTKQAEKPKKPAKVAEKTAETPKGD